MTDGVALDPPSRDRQPRATMTRIAADLGVSVMTVSNAFTHPERVAEATLSRILETAERLGYAGPDPVARALRRSRTDMIGVLSSNPLSSAFGEPAQVLFLLGLAKAAEAGGMGLALLPTAFGTSPGVGPAAATDAAVDGFLVYSTFTGDPLLDAARRRRLPLVIVDQPLVEGVPRVGIDDRAAAREIADHLLRLGHRRIAIVTFTISTADREPGEVELPRPGADLPVTGARLDGYREALEVAGVPWNDVRVHQCFGSSRGLGRAAAEALLGREPRPTAIIATSDQLALGVMDAATALGLSVPGELSVVGFDDVPEAATTHPSLTTVHQDHVEKGAVAGRILIASVRGEPLDAVTLLATRLMVRGSTGPPPT